MNPKPVIAVAGATGLVGNEVVVLLDELNLDCKEVRLLASEDSAGEVYKVGSEEAVVEVLNEDSFQGVDIALFATNAELSARFVPRAVEGGAMAIDISGHFAFDPNVPLIVPEVNGSALKEANGIISSPTGATVQLVPVLHAIGELGGLKRVVISAYESASGAGKHGLDELWSQTLSVFNQREMTIEAFPHQIAFNCIPQIGPVCDSGYTEEEIRIEQETRRVLGRAELRITATAVRVPVLYSHGEAVNVETERDVAPRELCRALRSVEGLQIYEDPDHYPMPLDAAGTSQIHVGRIRRDPSVPHGLNLWLVADNIRRGVALNAVRIAQGLIERAREV